MPALFSVFFPPSDFTITADMDPRRRCAEAVFLLLRAAVEAHSFWGFFCSLKMITRSNLNFALGSLRMPLALYIRRVLLCPVITLLFFRLPRSTTGETLEHREHLQEEENGYACDLCLFGIATPEGV